MDDLTASKLETAYELIKTGQRNQACEILIPLVRANPNLVDGWFLLGHAVRETKEKIRCFQQVLRLDPNNQPAQKQLARLFASQSASPLSGAKPVIAAQPIQKTLAKPVKKSAPQKKSRVYLWILVGLMGLFIGLSGFILWRRLGSPFLASAAPTLLGKAVPILPTLTLTVSTLTPESSRTPKLTSRPTITLHPTSTLQPSVTTIPTSTVIPSLTPTIDAIDTPKPKGFGGCLTPNGLGALTTPFKIENFGDEKATVYLNGTSRNGNYTINCKKTVKQGVPVFFTLMWGDYEYIVMRGSTTRSGTFSISQNNKLTMRIFKDKIRFGEFR